MYRITCDGFTLFDPRDDELVVENPVVNLEVNTVGEGSFTIYKNHPYYGTMKKLKSVFEVTDDVGVIFRGRMTEDSADFESTIHVDLEGVMAYFNDSTIRPFNFPADFANDADYIAASEGGNVVSFFLNWLVNQHNSQVQDFQKFKLGTVTVADPNNYLFRESAEYASTWETLSSKLFDSGLGGYLCIRYEEDGNYIDYLSEFELTNTQEIAFGENLMDLTTQTDATGTYSAIIPLGVEIEVDGATKRLTIESLADGNITSDIVKQGDTLYSRSAVEAYGWRCVPVFDSTWDDVTEAQNLLSKGLESLVADKMLLAESIEVVAVDLHFTDEQIQSFRIYRNVKVISQPHGYDGIFPLPKLSLDLQNPQNTLITVGATQRTLIDINSQKESDTVQRVESVKKDIAENKTEISNVKTQVITQSTEILNSCSEIILSALESYVETSNYDEFKRTVETQLEIMSDQIVMNFTTTTEQITNVDGDMQSNFNKLYKHIAFSGENGIVIGSGKKAISLTVDTKGIVFSRNGVAFGFWNGNDFYTGNIIVRVNERAQFGNFAYVPRSDGSLMFVLVGGGSSVTNAVLGQAILGKMILGKGD